MHPKWLTGFLPSNRSDPLSNPVVVHMFAEANFFREFSKPQSKSGPLKFRHLSYQIVTRSQKSQKCRLSFPKNYPRKTRPWLPKNGWPIQFCLNLTCICSKPTNPPTAGSCLSSGPWDSSPHGCRGYPYASPPAVASPDAKRLLLATSPKAGWKHPWMTTWWFPIYFIFWPLPGKVIQFD